MSWTMAERRFVVPVERCPDRSESGELLELVLAAASLELDLTVWLRGTALGVLTGPDRHGWQQLIDHDLARVCASDCPDGSHGAIPDGVELLDPADVLELERGTVIIRP